MFRHKLFATFVLILIYNTWHLIKSMISGISNIDKVHKIQILHICVYSSSHIMVFTNRTKKKLKHKLTRSLILDGICMTIVCSNFDNNENWADNISFVFSSMRWEQVKKKAFVTEYSSALNNEKEKYSTYTQRKSFNSAPAVYFDDLYRNQNNFIEFVKAY